MHDIPEHYIHIRTTPFWTKENAPPSLFMPHNTPSGVYGRLSVMQGEVNVMLLSDTDITQPRQEKSIPAGAFCIVSPQQWQRVDITDPDTYFAIDFFADPNVKLQGVGLSNMLKTDTGNELTQ